MERFFFFLAGLLLVNFGVFLWVCRNIQPDKAQGPDRDYVIKYTRDGKIVVEGTKLVSSCEVRKSFDGNSYGALNSTTL